jgi:uncharacterized membrane protein
MENEKYFNLIPSIGGSFSFAWRKMFGNVFLILLATVLIVGLLNGSSAGAKMNFDGDNNFPLFLLFPAILFGLAYSFLFLPIIKYGENYIFLKAMRDEEVDIKILFEGFKTNYLNIILANLIVAALVIIGFIMLIVPGIIIACRLVFVPFLVMDKNLDPIKAVEKSWEMSKGHGWEVFFMVILSAFIFIGGVLVFIIGAVVSIIWIHATFATFYQAVLNEKEEDNPIPILGVNEE